MEISEHKLVVFWFRRDLRLEDNTALNHALNSGKQVLLLFIFDEDIIDELPVNDARLSFIYDRLVSLNHQLERHNSSILCTKGTPYKVWKELIAKYEIDAVFVNDDYEPYGRQRDAQIKEYLRWNGIKLCSFKDHVIFEKDEILKADGKPYTVFTPYKLKWIDAFKGAGCKSELFASLYNFYQNKFVMPSRGQMGLQLSLIKVAPYNLSVLKNYSTDRDYPALNCASHLGPHLRFGTVSIRKIVSQLGPTDEVFLSELIWREFFMQILYHFPEVVTRNFRSKYDGIEWRQSENDFKRWSTGNTGYPLVDAGMRELNETGVMHNRVRMIAAGFLCKHLLIDWRLGEAYFASRLLDYELSSNNGNWQWAAGTGCDAAPYFRIFNPQTQMDKFDKGRNYVTKWVSEYNTSDYPQPMIDHHVARLRALDVYKNALL